MKLTLNLSTVMARSLGVLSTVGSGKLFDAVDPGRHPRLSCRNDTNASRLLAVNHRKSSIAAAHLKDLYADLTQYLREVLGAAAAHGIDPGRFVGEHGFETDAKTLLSLGSWPAVVQYVSDTVYQQMESERSTKALVRKVSVKLGLQLDQAVVDTALPYLVARHLLVHADGIVSADFANSYPGIGLSEGDSIPLGYSFILAARQAIKALAEEIDQKAVAAGIFDHGFLQP